MDLSGLDPNAISTTSIASAHRYAGTTRSFGNWLAHRCAKESVLQDWQFVPHTNKLAAKCRRHTRDFPVCTTAYRWRSVPPRETRFSGPNKPRQCQLSSAHNGDVALIWDPSRRVRGSSRARKVTFSSLARFGFLATFLLYAARLQRGPRPARPGAPLPTPALRPCSSAPQNPPQPMHRPARPLIAPLCRAGDAR